MIVIAVVIVVGRSILTILVIIIIITIIVITIIIITIIIIMLFINLPTGNIRIVFRLY